MVNGPGPGPAPAAQARDRNSRLTRSSWQTWPHRKLRRKAPKVEGAQGGGCLDCAAQGAGGPTGAQHVGVVNAVATSQRRRNQGHHLVAGVRPARRIAQVEALLDQLGQAQAPGQGGRKDQPGIGHQAVVVEGDLDAVGMVRWQHLLGAPFLGSVLGSVWCYKPLSQKHGSTFLPLQDADPTPSFGGFGLSLGHKSLASICHCSRNRSNPLTNLL